MPEHTENLQEQFADNVVWITGASSGIGEALAKVFAANGARLVLSARNETELQRVRDECIGAGADAGNLLVVPLDVVDHAAMPGAVATVKENFSRDMADMLYEDVVNACGVLAGVEKEALAPKRSPRRGHVVN